MVYKHCLTCMSLSKLFTSDVLEASFQGSISPPLSLDIKTCWVGRGRKSSALHSHGWVHLLFAAGVRIGRLDLPVATLQTVKEGGHRGQRHRVVLHSVAHVLRVQVLPLVRHDLGSLLAVQH